MDWFCSVFNENDDEYDVEEIKHILSLAKLEAGNLASITQVLFFAAENDNRPDIKLLKVDEQFIKELSESGTVYIKGPENDYAVLCTETSTYDLLNAETSNSLMLVENIKFLDHMPNTENRSVEKVVVHSILHQCLELSPTRAKLQRLRQILHKSIFKGVEFEDSIDKNNLYTYNDLLNTVQASRRELDAALARIPIVILDNKIRKLDFDYHFRVLSYMLQLIEENSWAPDEIDCDETLKCLSELVPTEILSAVFDFYTESSKVIDGLQLYRYKSTDVCRIIAKALLSHTKKFNLPDFLTAWQEAVPEGMVTELDMLEGLAVIDYTTNIVHSFDEEILPENVIERFEMLFHMKPKWTVSEITPYIENLTTPRADVASILAKYARVSSVNGVKYYSSKHIM